MKSVGGEEFSPHSVLLRLGNISEDSASLLRLFRARLPLRQHCGYNLVLFIPSRMSKYFQPPSHTLPSFFPFLALCGSPSASRSLSTASIRLVLTGATHPFAIGGTFESLQLLRPGEIKNRLNLDFSVRYQFHAIFRNFFRDSFRFLEIPFDFSNKKREKEATKKRGLLFLVAIIKNICEIDQEVDHGTRKLKIDVYDIYEERNRSSFIECGDKKKKSLADASISDSRKVSPSCSAILKRSTRADAFRSLSVHRVKLIFQPSLSRSLHFLAPFSSPLASLEARSR